MPPPSPAPPEEEGWQVVSPEWWRIPYSAVSWAYTPAQDIAANKATQFPRVAKPPHYHASLFHIRGASDDRSDEDLPEGDDGRLNPDLIGCQGALAALESYEIDVGFHWPPSPIEQRNLPDLAVPVHADRVALGKEHWDELVQDLMGGLPIGSPDRYHESDDDSLSDVHRSTSTHSSIDLTDSDRSVVSLPMPATPRARRSYANIVVKRPSPSRSTSSRDSDRSPRRLNAAASSFVPSPSKVKPATYPLPFLTTPESVTPESVRFPSLDHSRTPSPSSPAFNTTFVFPSLDVPPLPAVKIAKDAQGFYSEVESAVPAPGHARTSSNLLPAFLSETSTRRRPAASKTRAMVDRLKSSASGASQEPPKAPPPRPQQLELSELAKPRLSVSEYGGDGDSPVLEDDNEGWIVGDDLAAAKASVKTRRTRDLFLALTRRRSNSSPPKTTVIVDPPADDVSGIKVELPSPVSSSSEGWIEGPALLVPEPKAKAKAGPVHLPERKSTPSELKPAAAHRQHVPRTPKKAKRHGPPPAMHAPPPVPVPAVYVRPPPYYYPHPHPHAHPHAAPPMPAQYAAYMHQMQVLQMQQQQMHMRHVSAPVAMPVPVHTPGGSISSTGSGEWFPYPVPVAAYPVPALHAPVFVPRGV